MNFKNETCEKVFSFQSFVLLEVLIRIDALQQEPSAYLVGGWKHGWMGAIHYICLSFQISDKSAFNNSIHNLNQEYPIWDILDSTVGKRNTIRKIYHLALLPHHEWPALSQMAIPEPVASPMHKTASLFPDFGAMGKVILTREEKWA